MNFEDILKVKGAPQDGFDEDGNPIEQPEENGKPLESALFCLIRRRRLLL